MSFPLGTIPSDATVLSASLELWTEGAIADVTKPIGRMDLQRLLGTPVEGSGVGSSSTNGQGTGVSWTSRTGTINWTTAGGDFDGSTTPGLLATLPGYAPYASGLKSTFTDETALVADVLFSVPGDYLLRLTASNAFGEISRTLAVTVAPNPDILADWQIGRLADWQTLHWPGVSDPDIIGETADPDHDGLPNLLEFALGKSPKTPNPAPTSLQFQPTDGILFSYTRKLGVTGMVSLVEWSETLADGSWSSISVGGETILSYDPPADIEVVSVPVSTGTSGRRFVRLRVARE